MVNNFLRDFIKGCLIPIVLIGSVAIVYKVASNLHLSEDVSVLLATSTIPFLILVYFLIKRHKKRSAERLEEYRKKIKVQDTYYDDEEENEEREDKSVNKSTGTYSSKVVRQEYAPKETKQESVTNVSSYSNVSGNKQETELATGASYIATKIKDDVAETLEKQNLPLGKYDPKKEYGMENYQYPKLSLLKCDNGPKIDTDYFKQQDVIKNHIVETLRSFNIEIREIQGYKGYVTSLYEVTLDEGANINKVKNFKEEIKLSLAFAGANIIVPIWGKPNVIGIEIPNETSQTLSIGTVISSKGFQETQMELPIALGRTEKNEVFLIDLAKMPNLLIGGMPGTGKSACLNAIITSLLYKKHPCELKFILIDANGLEFNLYKPLSKHFLTGKYSNVPILSDVEQVIQTLDTLSKEMDDRYDLMKKASVRKITEYNEKFINRQLNPENGHRIFPYIVVIIDEYNSFMQERRNEFESSIVNLAQLGPAVGIHIVMATRTPTLDIISGSIRAYFPGRIAFKTYSKADSVTILETQGAEKLLTSGDMFVSKGTVPVRVQCAYIETSEIVAVNDFISSQRSYPEMWELSISENIEVSNDLNLDPLFEDAARLVVTTQQGTYRLIQREYSIGFNRAGRLMDQLEKFGIVGPASGSHPREVLIQDLKSLDKLLQYMKQ